MKLHKGRQIKVMFMGLRGLPGVQGGVETHVEKLAPLLAELGCTVEVLVRSPYQPDVGPLWRGVQITSLWSPRAGAIEAVFHSLLCVIYAAFRRPDVLHVHAIGPALVVPLARLFGLRVVVTHHGPDYERQKWGIVGRTALKLGEWLGMRISNQRIAISPVVRRLIHDRHGLDAVQIPNGVDRPEPVIATSALALFGLVPQRYVLIVSRLVPEKRHGDLVSAFHAARLPAGWKLAIVGGADHPGPYTQELDRLASRSQGVVLTGVQTGDVLQQLYAHAGMFVLPSSHEGLPIALLEAISHGLPVAASDIAANKAVGLPDHCYFPLGHVGAAAARIQEVCQNVAAARQEAQQIADELMPRYNWMAIAHATLQVYADSTKHSSTGFRSDPRPLH
jgi:glycosyltransferase involved in cell wall biosynthesis